MVVPKLTLWYFGIGGRAEPIRLAAAIGKVAFTNKAVDFKDFPEVRKTLPLGQLPILEIEEEGKEKVTLTQSEAILRYFAKLGGAGLYPEEPLEAAKVDAICQMVTDATNVLTMSVGGAVRHNLSETEWTNDEKLAIRKRIMDNVFPKYLGLLNKAIESNGNGWLVGSGATIADLRLYQVYMWLKGGILDGIPPSVLEQYPQLIANAEKVESHPQVVEWKKSHPQPYPDFDFTPN